MRKTVSFLLALLITCAPVVVNADGEAHSWCVKRGKNGIAPTVEKGIEEMLSEYNAYFMDKTLLEQDKVLYLTFDAGYENGNVTKILDILKEEDAHGAFFVLAHTVRSAPELVARMEREGHLVCNHTAKHPDLTKRSETEIRGELEALEQAYFDIAGKKLAPFFRPPEGKYDKRVLSAVCDMGYTTVFWSLAYADWCDEVAPSDEKAESILKKNTHNGAVILLHPTSDINVRILGKMLRYWKNEGYRFGSLSELKQK